ncbi:hypothetical protein WJX72_005272 [[Myrmecia] bisecta]|uniref:Uncharacterized protein n=1 Tax=[Myrmecia] bisecta TaxID=41462 RepID=A0AAW1QRJ0_9CHLO
MTLRVHPARIPSGASPQNHCENASGLPNLLHHRFQFTACGKPCCRGRQDYKLQGGGSGLQTQRQNTG